MFPFPSLTQPSLLFSCGGEGKKEGDERVDEGDDRMDGEDK